MEKKVEPPLDLAATLQVSLILSPEIFLQHTAVTRPDADHQAGLSVGFEEFNSDLIGEI